MPGFRPDASESEFHRPTRIPAARSRQQAQRVVQYMTRTITLLSALWLSSYVAFATEPFLNKPAPDEPAAAVTKASPWWNRAVSKALERAGDNRGELEQALHQVADDQQTGMAFLIEHMPEPDLRTLKADFLLENVQLAYHARQQVPWGKALPEELFLNYVLPYANVTERRDPWRREFLARCLPLVAQCETPAEAAHLLNQQLFKQVNVRYSTQRKRADQSPAESIEQGMASCTGLSILLVDACRAVAVPARLVGIAKWPNKPGNHTWVEIWDQRWHFTGACEADPNGLNRGWFVGDASLAQKDSRLSAIYAVSYAKTDTPFPMVWSRRGHPVHGVNVTDHYAKPKPMDNGETTELRIRVWNRGRKARISAQVQLKVIHGDRELKLSGSSKDASHDLNDMLAFRVPHHAKVIVRIVEWEGFAKELQLAEQPHLILDLESP